MKTKAGKAFTLIELLVVVAIIALLIAILLPTLKRAKDQAKKAVCLAHLRDIGSAAHEYATEDENNRAMPMSAIMVRAHGYWYKRCVMWYSWGGRGAPDPFYIAPTNFVWVNETNDRPYYGTRRRPLTVYLYPEIEPGRADAGPGSYMASDTPVFECPADRGFPELEEGVIDDTPPANAGYRMFDTVGSSYRGSLATLGGVGGGSAFSRGVWGQRLSRLESTSRLIWGGDPLFFNFIGTDAAGQGWPEVKKYGWHGDYMMDNELYADAHAEPTQAVSTEDPAWLPSDGELALWGINPAYKYWLARGPGWQIDAYPTPGVAISGFDTSGYDQSSWPFKGHSTCPKPPLP